MSVSSTVPDDYTLEIVFQRLDAARFASLPLRSPWEPYLRMRISLHPSTARSLDQNYHSLAGYCLTRHPLEIVRGTGI